MKSGHLDKFPCLLWQFDRSISQSQGSICNVGQKSNERAVKSGSHLEQISSATTFLFTLIVLGGCISGRLSKAQNRSRSLGRSQALLCGLVIGVQINELVLIDVTWWRLQALLSLICCSWI